MGQIRNRLDQIRWQMERAAGSGALAGQSSLAVVARYLRRLSADVGNNAVSVRNMQSALQEITRLYEETERRVLGMNSKDITTSEGSSFWERIMDQLNDLRKMMRDYLKGAIDIFCMFAGDPVNMSNGNYFLATRDLLVRGFTPIVWERNYNGMENSLSVLGRGWRHSHQWKVTREENGWILTEPDGSVLLFTEIAKGSAAQSGEGSGREAVGETGEGLARESGREAVGEAREGDFAAVSGEPCRLSVKEDRIEVTREDTMLVFDKDGRILERNKFPGGRIRYQYKDGRLTELQGEKGTFLRLHYDSMGLLTGVSASDGGYVSYEYEEGRLVKAQSAGACTEYGYDGEGRLEEIRGADGRTQLHNIYDGEDRIREQHLGGGGTLQYEYLKDRTVLTWPDGTEVAYVFDSSYRHCRTIYHDSEEKCTYNSRNQKTSFTDRLGRTTRYGYDPAGNLTFVVDPAGNRTSVTYDSRGRVTAVKRPDGGQTVWQYTSDGLVAEMKNAIGGVTRYSYNDEKLPVAILSPDGTQLQMAYDERGNMISCDADGVRIASAEYDGCNRRISESDGEGNTWKYAYDDAGRVICVTNPKGDQQHYEYDGAGRVSRHTDYCGNVSAFEYNDAGKPVLKTDVCGNVTEFLYDERQNLKEKRLPGGGVFTYAYDADNRLSRVMRDGEAFREYEYDAVGNMTCERDAMEHEIRYEYDVCDRVVRIIRADGADKSFAYDACGRKIRETDYEGVETLFEYDPEGNLTARTEPGYGRTEWQYTAGGLVERITEPTGQETRVGYGPFGKVKRMEIAGGRSEEYAYDACGRMIKESHSDGYVKTYTYDSCGYLTGIADGSGSRTAKFDAMGRVTEVTDQRGNSTCYTYRADGILTGILDPAGSSASYEYSPEGYLLKVVRRGSAYDAQTGRMEERESVTGYERDHWGRLLSETDPLGNRTSYAYDAADRMIMRTDRMGRETRMEYDPAGNMRELAFADGESSFMEYTPGRQLAYMEEAAGRVQIARDDAGRPVQVTGFDETETMFSYTEQGQLAATHYPDNAAVQYSYDSFGRPAQMKCGSLALSFGYDATGRLVSRTDEAGSGTAWEYGPDGTVVKIAFLKDGEPFKTCSYVYDACGNKKEVNWEYAGRPGQGSRSSYVYDALNRISEVYEEGARVRRYSYDGFGNRIRLEEMGAVTEYQYDQANRMILSRHRAAGQEAWEQTEYQYDAEGNRIRVSGPDGQWETRYDCRNHPVADDSDTKSVRRQYSSLGQLLATAYWEKTADAQGFGAAAQDRGADARDRGEDAQGFGNVFEMDGEAAKAAGISRMFCLNDHGAPVNRNPLLGVKRQDGTLLKYLRDPYGMLAAWMDGDGSAQLIWTDEQGSVFAAAGKDGQIAEAGGYDEFGNLTDPQKEITAGGLAAGGLAAGGMPEILPEVMLPGFAGLLPDPAGNPSKGKYTAGMRLYDPLTGRFTEEDPMMQETCGVQDQNLYTYCFNQPMTLVDNDGCFPSFSDMYNGLKDFNRGVKNTIQKGYNKGKEIVDWGRSKAEDAYNWGKSKVKQAYDWGSSKVKEVYDWGSSKVQEAWDWGRQKVEHTIERAVILYNIYTDPDFHYSRNRYNETPTDPSTVYEYDKNGHPKGKNGWEKLPDSANQCHVNESGEQGKEAAYNKKFVKKNPDGSSSEIIICFPPGKKPYVVDDYLNGGTYNYYNPDGTKGTIMHVIYDLVPYLIHGNSKEDEPGLVRWVNGKIDQIKGALHPGRNRQAACG